MDARLKTVRRPLWRVRRMLRHRLKNFRRKRLDQVRGKVFSGGDRERYYRLSLDYWRHYRRLS